jgi:hypothetical protein
MLVRQGEGTPACSEDCDRTHTIIWPIGGDILLGLDY